MGVKVYEANTVEPLTLDVVRKHLGIEPYEVDSSGTGDHPHDEMIMAMLGAAREYVENFTGRSVALKTYELALDSFPADEIELPYPPIVSIESVTYTTTDSSDDYVEETVEATDYALDQNQETAGWLKPAAGLSWPSASAVMNAVKVRYLAGYQDPEPASSDPAADPLPYAIRAALLLMVGHLYANREAVSDKAMTEVPFAVDALLRPLRVRKGFA